MALATRFPLPAMSQSLVFQEPPLFVVPTLAKKIGLEESVVFQQLFFLLQNPKNGKVLSDGERYIFNTYEGWTEHFPWLGERGLRRVFGALEELGLVLTCQPEGSFSRRKYYRVSYGAIAKLTYESVEGEKPLRLAETADDATETVASMRPKQSLPLTERTTENTNNKVLAKTSESEKIARLQLPFESDAFKHVWGKWTRYLGAANDARRAYKVLCELHPWGEERAMAALEKAIELKWQKPFEPTDADVKRYKPEKTRIPQNVRDLLAKEAK